MILPILAVASYALIVTNNRSLELSRPDLRYADDDGVKYAELFDESFGEENVLLLTELDAETRALYPQWIERAMPPTRAQLDQTVDVLVQALARNKEPSDVYVILAGHGDVDRGQGYIELADRRLSASDLEEKIIGRLEGARRIHLVLDSCNSYFMLNPRKPGGTRFAANANDRQTRDLLERHPNVGALISTSAEAVTYEWSEVQSGIFSYELRSGLRGAADANTDQQISYEELKAFLETANRSIENDLYRPKIYARGPKNDDTTLILEAPLNCARELELPKTGARRLTVRDRLGVRVLDLHKEDGTSAILRLPRSGELGVFEEVPALENARPTIAFRVYTSTATARVALDDLPLKAAPIAARGEAPVFQRVFAAPFGVQALEDYRAQPAEAEAAVYGVSQRDADRLGLYLRTTASYEREGRRLAALFSGGSALVLAGIGVDQLFVDEKQPTFLGIFSFATAAIFGAVAIGTVVTDSDSEDLIHEYASLDLSTEALRGVAVSRTEEKLRAIAEDYRDVRVRSGWIFLGLGALGGGAIGLSSGLSDRSPKFRSIDLLMLGQAAVFALVGVYQLWIHEYPAERTWSLYEHERELTP